MSDMFHHPSALMPKQINTDREIATALDAQFCLYRIGHAALGRDSEDVQARAHWLGLLITALDG